jgi:hypothetical protein
MPPLSSATEATTTSLGAKFAHSIARHDFAEVAELLHPAIDFRALTPRRAWEPATREDVLDLLRTWFDDCEIQEVLRVDTHQIAGRLHVTYRYQGERPDGPFLIEQQAYYDETDGQISRIQVLCSGFQPR